jgi:hypothetical protein
MHFHLRRQLAVEMGGRDETARDDQIGVEARAKHRPGGLASGDDRRAHAAGSLRLGAPAREEWREQHLRLRGLDRGSCNRTGIVTQSVEQGRRRGQERPASVQGSGVGPGREVRDLIELPQQTAHDVIAVAMVAELIEARHRLADGLLHFRDGARRVVLALRIETLLVFDEFFPIKGNPGIDVSGGDGSG